LNIEYLIIIYLFIYLFTYMQFILHHTSFPPLPIVPSYTHTKPDIHHTIYMPKEPVSHHAYHTTLSFKIRSLMSGMHVTFEESTDCEKCGICII